MSKRHATLSRSMVAAGDDAHRPDSDRWLAKEQVRVWLSPLLFWCGGRRTLHLPTSHTGTMRSDYCELACPFFL